MSSRRRKIQRLWQHERYPSSGYSDADSPDMCDFDSAAFIAETGDITVDQLLEVDPRPTFVLDFKREHESLFRPVFLNTALKDDHQLCSKIANGATDDAYSPGYFSDDSSFKSWIMQIPAGSASPTFQCYDMLWTGYWMKQFVVVSGQHGIIGPKASRPSVSSSRGSSYRQEIHREDRLSQSKRILSGSNDIDVLLGSQPNASLISFVSTGTPDWTVEHPQGELSPYIIWVRSLDWASTPLGHMNTWSPELRQVACLLMANPLSTSILWGKDLTMLYNQPYAEREAGDKHPALMGTGVKGPFSEIWHLLDPIFTECRNTGKGFSINNQLLPIERRGILEEKYYTWSLTPLYGGTNTLCGFYNSPFETTRQVLSGRALKTLLSLGQELGLAKSITEFWPKVLSALSENGFDFPLVVLYSVVRTEDPLSAKLGSGLFSGAYEMGAESEFVNNQSCPRYCRLEGTLGVPKNHPAAPALVDLKLSTDKYGVAFRDAMLDAEPKLVSLEDGSLYGHSLEGIQWQGFEEPSRHAIIFPVQSVTQADAVVGFLVIGINPRRTYDEDYQSFIQLLDRQLSTSLASVTLVEAEILRSKEAAKVALLERSRLAEQLEVERSRLQRIAEVSQVGMFSIDTTGLLLEANSRYFELTGHSRADQFEFSWMDSIHEDSRAAARDSWETLTIAQQPWTGELKLKQPSFDASTDEEKSLGTWIMAACQPEFDTDGKLKSVMGSITEISRKKWTEDLQAKRLEEADEMRRAQNNFIDITSHEMRNPLSAMIQCADGISDSLSRIIGSQSMDVAARMILQECLTSAETIQLCAQHQKSIVDDILTISKLDSQLLLISPVAIRPVEIVRQALQMFVVECQKVHDIKLDFHTDPSFINMKVNTVMLDSSRLLQVLINLLTNAIKFTKTSKKRTVDVFLGAYPEPPLPQTSDFEYFPSPHKRKREVTPVAEWGSGDVVFLRFEVKDSGCGLKPEEKQKLFNRFAQASPRTHVQYGGSGLGLFISRQLTELQGGEIGVASEDGQGSSFAFYVKTRRAEEAQAEDETARKRVSWDVQINAAMATDVPERFDRPHKFATALVTPVENPGPNVSDWHILIVEDNLVNQKILAQQIRKLGATVYVANHGEEALVVIRESKHFRGREVDGKELSVVLMDLEMPVMDGLTCVRCIREMEAEGSIIGRIPVIAVTANARDEQIMLARNSGMDDVMPKPFRIVQIKAKIESLLKKRLVS